ncbi:hypothetical protein Q7C15_17430 [Aeromonas salmonicida]|uniref:hypothetical protein n=1 Tax=Aeromonas salmonicida TaxID=645 RepID=UPI0035BEF938
MKGLFNHIHPQAAIAALHELSTRLQGHTRGILISTVARRGTPCELKPNKTCAGTSYFAR